MTPDEATNEAMGRPDAFDPRAVPFDAALLRVSNCLAEAEDCAARGYNHRAERLFRVAEAFAIQMGYLELVRLVWAYDPCSALTNIASNFTG